MSINTLSTSFDNERTKVILQSQRKIKEYNIDHGEIKTLQTQIAHIKTNNINLIARIMDNVYIKSTKSILDEYLTEHCFDF